MEWRREVTPPYRWSTFFKVNFFSVKMEKIYYTTRAHLLHFRLDYCCWFAPVRVGLMITGYFNVIADVVCLLGIANDGFSPTITRVQEILIEDFINKPIPVIAYAIELAFSVVLLCAIHRRDIVLMRVFMYYTILAVIMSFLVYSIVFIAVPLQIQLSIIFSTAFQMYVVLLVRSVIVETKIENKQYELPKLVMSSMVQEKPAPGSYFTKKGEMEEVTITKVPKRQDVFVTVVGSGKDEKIKTEIKDEEVNKDAEVIKAIVLKKEAEVKDNESKKDAQVKDKILKVDSGVKFEIESKNKDTDEKKNKDEKKEEKKIKDEKKKEEKKNKDVEKTAKTKSIFSRTSKKDLKETSLQTVNENPKE